MKLPMDSAIPSQDNQSNINNRVVSSIDTSDQEPPKRLRNGLLIKIFGVLIVLLIISNGFFVYQYLNTKQTKQDTVASLENSQPTQEQGKIPGFVKNTSSLISEYQVTHTEEENKYPYRIQLIPSFDPNEVWTVSINTLDDLRKHYQEASKEGCPGPCSLLIEGNNLENQFEILTRVSNLPNCELNDEIKEEINNFYLFAGGIEDKKIIGTIYNPNLETCGLKHIGMDGYDYYLGNYEYEVGFIKDNKIIEIKFELLPIGKITEIDQIWQQIGYNFEESSLSGENWPKMEEYMKNINLEDGVIKQTINTFDDSVRSFTLLD